MFKGFLKSEIKTYQKDIELVQYSTFSHVKKFMSLGYYKYKKTDAISRDIYKGPVRSDYVLIQFENSEPWEHSLKFEKFPVHLEKENILLQCVFCVEEYDSENHIYKCSFDNILYDYDPKHEIESI